jgi:hypothetical protein
MVAFNPSAGEYPLYEDVFSNLAEAETKAWEKAQETALVYRQPIRFSGSMGRMVSPPPMRKKKSPIPPRWRDWDKFTDTERIKRYSFHVKTKGNSFAVTAELYSPNTGGASSPWIVIISTHTFPEGNKHTIFEGTFPEFIEAEDKAWKEAREVLNSLKQRAA